MNLQIASRQLLINNRRHEREHQYTVPSSTSYPFQWFWDSCFHTIILAHYNNNDAKKEIFSLFAKQFQNGMLPHLIYWKDLTKEGYPKVKWGRDDTSTITQPPMVAYAVWEIYQKDKDKDFLKEVYPNLYHFYRYLLTERDPHEKHLIGIMNPDESGEDNSPRFDPPLNLQPKQTLEENTKRRHQLIVENIDCKFDAPFCMRNFFWVKDVPFNAIMVKNLTVLSEIAKELGNHDDATYFASKSDEISSAMRKYMLDGDLFYSTYGEDYKKIKVKTWAIFSPLFAKILSEEEASQLVHNHLLNKQEFWTNFPIPTVSQDEPSFDPLGFWRGPTWISVNWFVYKGLLNYGFTDIAKQIQQTSRELIQKSGFREYYNPITGEGLGAHNFTWGTLIEDMMAD